MRVRSAYEQGGRHGALNRVALHCTLGRLSCRGAALYCAMRCEWVGAGWRGLYQPGSARNGKAQRLGWAPVCIRDTEVVLSAYRMRRGHYAASVTRLAVSQPADRFTVQLLDGGPVVQTRCLQVAGADLRLLSFPGLGLTCCLPVVALSLRAHLLSAISTRKMTKIATHYCHPDKVSSGTTRD